MRTVTEKLYLELESTPAGHMRAVERRTPASRFSTRFCRRRPRLARIECLSAGNACGPLRQRRYSKH